VQALRSLIGICTLLGCVFLEDRGLVAQQLGADFTNAFERAPIANSNYGWAFTVTSSLVVDGLGLWDARSDGLVEKHEVGIWRTSGPTGAPVLIASEDVSNNDSLPVPSLSPNGRWLFTTISAVTLAPGSYILGAIYRSGPSGSYDPFVSDALTISTTPGITYGSTREIHNTEMLSCPTDFGLNEHNGFFGPNIRLVPEASVPLLIAAGAFFLGRRAATDSRRHRATDFHLI
jgi:hypothetical protein